MTQPTTAELLAQIAQLQAALADANKPKALSVKIGEKGTVCVYGLGRFPVSLYGTQWQRLAEYIPTVMAFCKAHPETLQPKVKANGSLAEHMAARQASGLPV